MSRRDYRDDVIEVLAVSEATLQLRVDTLLEEVACAKADREAYRLVAVAGLHHAHALGLELTTLRERHYRVLDDARTLRAQLIAVTTGRKAAA